MSTFNRLSIRAFVVSALATATAWGLDADDVRRATEADRGVAVVIDDAVDLAAGLASDGQMIVHLLAPRFDRVFSLNEDVKDLGLGGRVVVGVLPADGHLPHADRFVNLLVADLDALGDRAPSEREWRRVVSTRGAAYLKRNGKWAAQRTAADTRLDNWTHRWYDASGNCLSHDRVAAFPRAVQWQHGPAMEDGTADGKIPRIADGRWVIVDSSSGDLICRDAGNGTLLWRSPLGLSPRDELAVVDGRVYFYLDADAKLQDRNAKQPSHGPLVAVELATGKVVQTYDESLRAGTAAAVEFYHTDQQRTRRETPVPWFVVDREIIVQAYANDLVVLDRNTGRRRWSQPLESGSWFSPVVASTSEQNGSVVLAAKAVWPARRGRHDGSGNVREVVAFAAADGKQLWSNDNVHPERSVQDKERQYLSRAEFKPMSVADGLVLLHASSYQFRQGGSIAVLDLKSGRELWRHELKPKERYTQGSQRAVLRSGEVVLMDGLGALRFDARTGEPIGEPLDNRQGLRRMARTNGACTASRATLDWLICNAYLFIGPDGEPQPHFGTRGACGQGVVPAHGLVFVPPTPCDCGDYMRGHIAMAPTLVGREIADSLRLLKGPAYLGDRNDGIEIDVETPAGWPTFLGDQQRRSHQAKPLPANLTQNWHTRAVRSRIDGVDADRRFSERYLGALSAPVADEQIVLVAAPESHEIIALAADDGRRRWSFAAGGKVDSPPTLVQCRSGSSGDSTKLAVFGCDDGCVYAVRATDGKLSWRFHAAPTDAVSMHHGHLASAFPLPGSVSIVGGNVIAVAGHHTDLGGLECWIIDLLTGRSRAHRVIRSDQPRVVANGVTVVDDEGFWIGKQLHLSAIDLKDMSANWYDGPHPAVALDRAGARMRFRTNEGRGGSTHSWKGAMSVPGRNKFLRGHRLASTGDIVYGLLDPTPRNLNSPMLWATKPSDQTNTPLWGATAADLGSHESYGALITAGNYLYLGGGARDGSSGILQVVDANSGRLLATHKLPARVAECGLAATGGQLIISCEDGNVVCFR